MRLLSSFLAMLSVAQFAFAGFDDVEIKTGWKRDYVLGVMVSDQRETVLKWGAAENLIGAHHSGIFRNRKELLTGTEAPVSEEMQEGLRKQFLSKWLSVAPIPAATKETNEVLEERIRKAKLPRTILVTVKSLWVEAENNNRTAVNFGFDVAILNDKASVVAKRTLEGVQNSDQWGYWGATEVFGSLMSSVLADPEIANALLK